MPDHNPLTDAEADALRLAAEQADPSPMQCIHETMDAPGGLTLHYCTLILGVRTLVRAADTARNRADLTATAAAYNAVLRLLADRERAKREIASLQANLSMERFENGAMKYACGCPVETSNGWVQMRCLDHKCSFA